MKRTNSRLEGFTRLHCLVLTILLLSGCGSALKHSRASVAGVHCSKLESESAPFCSRSSLGHRPVARDAVYVEFVGQSHGITVNLEHKLFDTQPHNMSLRAGIGGFLFWLSTPVSVSYLFGGDHKLEIGTGWLYMSSNMFDGFINRYVTGFAGYRYENARSGFLFRAGVTPFYSYSDTDGSDNEIHISAGISVGYTFK